VPGLAPVPDWSPLFVKDQDRLRLTGGETAFEDIAQWERQWQQAGLFRFRACRVESHHAAGQVHFVPRQAGDLAAPPACEVTEVEDITVSGDRLPAMEGSAARASRPRGRLPGRESAGLRRTRDRPDRTIHDANDCRPTPNRTRSSEPRIRSMPEMADRGKGRPTRTERGQTKGATSVAPTELLD
jgi:hypothetical protein